MILFFPFTCLPAFSGFYLHHHRSVGHCGLGSALTLLVVDVPMTCLNLYLCNFSKFPPYKPIYDVLCALGPGEMLTAPWPMRAAPTAQLLHSSKHFLTFSIAVLQAWEERYTNISRFTSFFVFFKVFFPQVPIKIGTNSTAAMLRALPCLSLKVPHYAPSSHVLPLSS